MGSHQDRCQSLQRPLKIALIGYGKMGKAIEAVVKKRNHILAAVIDRHLSSAEISENTLADADVCIDFSSPETVVDNIRKMARCKKNIVVGTTGWNAELPTVQSIVEEQGIGLLYAPNFSIGVNLFYQIAAHAAKLIDPFDDYDVAIHEVHHKQKLDAPSGTGLALGQSILDAMQRKSRLIYGNESPSTDPAEIHLSYQRNGANPGLHTVIFDSPEDTITLSHQARNREGFAKGAVVAAEWLIHRQGLFKMEHLIASLMSR